MTKKLFIFFAIIGFTTITMAQDSRVSKVGLYKPTANEKAREYYNDANEKFEIQDYEQAIFLYKKAIQEDSNYIDAYDNLGLSYRKLNLLDSAELYYKLSIEKYPQGITAIQNMAVIYNIRGDFKSADHYYQLIIESEPENPEGYYGMSKSAYFQGKYADALLNAQLAEKYYLIANSPIGYLGDNYYLKSRIYYSMKDIKAARKYLELAKSNGIDVDPEFEKALKIEIKTLVNRENFIVKYYQNEEYLDIIIESNYTPFIYTDINSNNKTDPYIDKLYSVINGNSLCVANQLENNATTTCNQSTSATLDVNLKNYHFVIPKKELRYTLSKPIYISFGAFDKNSTTKYLITNRKKSYIIKP